MFLLHHSEGCNTSEILFHWCYINDLHTTHAVVYWVTALPTNGRGRGKLLRPARGQEPPPRPRSRTWTTTLMDSSDLELADLRGSRLGRQSGQQCGSATPPQQCCSLDYPATVPATLLHRAAMPRLPYSTTPASSRRWWWWWSSREEREIEFLYIFLDLDI
jgi:hypothetical protein